MVDPTGHENLRDLVTYVGGSISYNAAAKAATVTIYKNGEYHNYTFSQQFFTTIEGRIQCSRSAFKNIISKPGTVYKHKETKKTTPLRPIVSVNASAARWQGGTQYVYFAESKEIYVYGSGGRTMSMANGSLMTGTVTGLQKPSDYESGYIGGSGNIGPVAGSVTYSGKNSSGEKIMTYQAGLQVGQKGLLGSPVSPDAGYTKILDHFVSPYGVDPDDGIRITI